MAALPYPMKPGASKVRIGYEALYARNVLQDSDERTRIERVEQLPQIWVQHVRVKALFQALLDSVEPLFRLVGSNRKFPETHLENFRWQEVIDHNVRVRVSARIAIM